MHTSLNLRGSIPEFILVTDGKDLDSNMLDVIAPLPFAIYQMDKAYVDFEALYRIQKEDTFFVTRAKASLKYEIIEQNLNIDQWTKCKAQEFFKSAILTKS